MKFVDKVLTEQDIHQIYVSGELERLYVGSKGFFNKGTYNYPGLDFTDEEIDNAGDQNHVDFWYNMCLSYVQNNLGNLVKDTDLSKFIL